jgi:hypothetical protein
MTDQHPLFLLPATGEKREWIPEGKDHRKKTWREKIFK